MNTTLSRVLAAAGLISTFVLGHSASPAVAAPTTPIFTIGFAPETIGPGSTSTLTFTIDNTANSDPLDGLAFTNTLPAGVSIADPANAGTTCPSGSRGPGLTLSAPAGASTISFSGASLGGGARDGRCEVTVDVTSSTAGTHTNTTSTLTSNAPPAAEATDDLTVSTSLPGFSKAFAPATVPIGDRSTLTLTIDNSMNAASVPNLDFSDALPLGLEVASPADASTTCGTTVIPATLTANPGATAVALDANGTSGFPAVAAGATCSVTVDVATTSAGTLVNSVDLLAEFVDAGAATAALTVTSSTLGLRQEFTNDPVLPGDPVDLEFTLANNDRGADATAVAFTNTLPGGAVFASVTSNGCGGTVAGSGTSTLSYSGGTVGAASRCSINVEVTAPATPSGGTYVNTTEPVTGTVGGSSTSGNRASDTLFVVPAPQLTQEFLDAPIGTGGDVVLRYTITNPSAAGAMTDVEFLDELTDGSADEPSDPTSGFLPFPVDATFPTDPCGSGSSIGLIAIATDRQAVHLTGGTLGAAGSPGDTCTFDVTITIPVGLAGNTYVNHTEEISAVIGGATVVGAAASDDVVIVAPPRLTKEFTDGPVAPGDAVNLRFTLEHQLEGTTEATAIAFSDDLDAALSGLSATAVAGTTCTGATVDISNPAVIDVSGAALVPGADCTIDVTLAVPAGAPDAAHTNTTNEVSAVLLGVTALGNPASADLRVSSLFFTKDFLENPYVAGQGGTLRYTFDNQSGTDISGLFFTDDLDSALPGLATTGAPIDDTCDGSSVGPADLVVYADGTVAAGSSCTIEFSIVVPGGAADGTYPSVTSALSHSEGTTAPATADLVVDSALLQLTKDFTDDPVFGSGDVTLEYELRNLSAIETVTDVGFSDDLDAALGGLAATAASTDTCGGTITSAFPASSFGYAGATLAPGASCTIVLTVAVPPGSPAGVYPGTTSPVAGLVGTLPVSGPAASDDLTVHLMMLSAAFDGPTGATGTAELTFTIDNLDPGSAVTGLSFTNDLDDVLSGLVATSLPATPCGAGSTISGTSFLTFTGGDLGAGGSCTFVVTVTVPATAVSGSYNSTTSALTSNGLIVADAASASLTVEPPPAFTKTFSPATIVADTTSTLTFTIDNSASAADITDLSFTDTFPAGVVIATPSATSNTCTGGTVVGITGSGSFNFAGGSLAAGAICTLSVDVTSAVAGDHVNVTSDLTSSTGNSGSASDTLTVTARTAPTVTIDRAAGQPDITSTAPIEFTVVFDEAVTGFDTAGVDVVNGTVASITPAGPNTYTVAVNPSTDGVVSATVRAGAAVDDEGTANLPSTSTDNSVVYDATGPIILAPADIERVSGTGSAIVVTYPTPTATDGSGSVAVRCTPASGSSFDIGVTPVTCTATDAAGNTASAGFSVTVRSNATLPETGGGLDGLTLALQFVLAGLGLVVFSRRRVAAR